MATHKRCGWRTVAIGLVLCATAAPAWATGNGDYNGDGTIDLLDYAEFPACMAGPGGGLGTGCAVFDFDGDVDVDAFDFAEFQKVFGTTVAPPDMVLVAAGEFEMGDSFYEGAPNELPVHDVYLDAYYIDTYEVTNQQYADALNWAKAQGGLIHVSGGVVYKYGGTSYAYCDTRTISSYSRITWNGSTFGITSGKEDHPMVQVSWYGAVAYCNWRSAMEGRTPCYTLADPWPCDFDADGFRLPTEAEWEKAAGWDPDLAYHFRFGEHTDGCGYNCLDGQRANYYGSGDPFETGPFPWTTPAGYYDGSNHGGYQTQDAQSYYGCRDMSGNVHEWCHDWYDSGYYSSSPYDNPTGPGSGTDRVLRGGSCSTVALGCRVAFRYSYSPGLRYPYYGFRCAVGTP